MNSDLTLVPLEKKEAGALSLMGFITPVRHSFLWPSVALCEEGSDGGNEKNQPIPITSLQTGVCKDVINPPSGWRVYGKADLMK